MKVNNVTAAVGLLLTLSCNGSVDRDQDAIHPGSGGGVSMGGTAEGGASGEAGHALGGTGGVVPVYCDTEDNVPEGFVCYLGQPCPVDRVREDHATCECLELIDDEIVEFCPDGYICWAPTYMGHACYDPEKIPQNGGPK